MYQKSALGKCGCGLFCFCMSTWMMILAILPPLKFRFLIWIVILRHLAVVEMASTGWLKGRVKAVPSGDSLVIMGSSKAEIPPEKSITLASLMAPRLVWLALRTLFFQMIHIFELLSSFKSHSSFSLVGTSWWGGWAICMAKQRVLEEALHWKGVLALIILTSMYFLSF